MSRKKQQHSKKSGRAKMLGSIFSEVFDMPEELAMDMPRITLIGNLKLSVENHKGIMEYSENQIKLRVNDGFLVAKGHNLLLRNISPDEVLLQGEILQMSIVLDQSDGTELIDWEA